LPERFLGKLTPLPSGRLSRRRMHTGSALSTAH